MQAQALKRISGAVFDDKAFSVKAFSALAFAMALVVLPPQIVEAQTSQGGGGGASYDAGTGYVKTEHGWVKLTKFVRAGAEVADYTVLPRGVASIDIAQGKVTAYTACVASSMSIDIGEASTGAHAHVGKVTLSSNVEIDEATLTAMARPCKIEWLSADEILMILEEI